MVRNGELLTALQAQPEPAVTGMLPVPPAAGNDWLAEVIAGAQPDDAKFALYHRARSLSASGGLVGGGRCSTVSVVLIP